MLSNSISLFLESIFHRYQWNENQARTETYPIKKVFEGEIPPLILSVDPDTRSIRVRATVVIKW